MFTQSELAQILALIQSTSERKAAETLGVTHAVLQRAVPLPLSKENEDKIRLALQASAESDPQLTPKQSAKLAEKLLFLKEKEALLKQRDERRRLQREDEWRKREEEKERRRAEKKRRREELKYPSR